MSTYMVSLYCIMPVTVDPELKPFRNKSSSKSFILVLLVGQKQNLADFGP